VFLPLLLTLIVILTLLFETNKTFTPTPLWAVNDVKLKRQKCPCGFTLVLVFVCDCTPVLILLYYQIENVFTR
jgi:hypothetical protein